MLDIALKEIGPLVAYQHRIFRVVETQAYAATTTLVDDLDEQALLEQMLDEVKPPYKEETLGRHYLISTPFRYPPLRFGSRFGSRTMPSYFYASEDEKTSLAECAYYRFCFLADMDKPWGGSIKSDHMMFAVSVCCEHTADLTQVSTPTVVNRLQGVRDYAFTQALGKQLVEEHSAKVIRYFSARAAKSIRKGVNVAVSDPDAITSLTPENSVNWICHTTQHTISFNTQGQQPISFARTLFCVDGEFPAPA